MIVPAIIFGVALLIAQNECKKYERATTQVTSLPLEASPGIIVDPEQQGSLCLFSAWSAWDQCVQCKRSKRREVEMFVPSISVAGLCKPCSDLCEEQCLAQTCGISSFHFSRHRDIRYRRLQNVLVATL